MTIVVNQLLCLPSWLKSILHMPGGSKYPFKAGLVDETIALIFMTHFHHHNFLSYITDGNYDEATMEQQRQIEKAASFFLFFFLIRFDWLIILNLAVDYT